MKKPTGVAGPGGNEEGGLRRLRQMAEVDVPTEGDISLTARVTEIRAAPEGSHVYDHVIFCFACALPATVVVPTPRDAPGQR
ncbi:hypothetical protein [Streptomyces goshikiensis]|uniref:hypothetical protein n=1 Tax=Streptomyces goshikiensis TaxID=1942 RepID=UPI003683F686